VLLLQSKESRYDYMLTQLGKILSNPFIKANEINAIVIVELVKKWLNSDSTILEIGPGYDPLIKRVECKEKIALDLPHTLEICKALGFKCIGQDATLKWMVDDESVDMVVSNQCLEHIPNTDHFVKEVYRVLKKGGYFIVSAPNEGSLVSIISLIFTISPPMSFVSDEYYMLGNPLSHKRFAKRNYPYTGYGHLRLFTIRGMDDLLKIHSFQIIKNHGGSWGIPLIGKRLANWFPHYGVYTTVLAKKL
jgi:SAM-dependent methyltransferase